MQRMVPVVLALFGCVGSSSGSHAQPEPLIDGRLVQAGTDTFKVSYAGNRIGLGITTRSRTGSADDAQLLQVYTWRAQNGLSIIDSLFVDAATLRTIREVRVLADTVTEMAYSPNTVEITHRAKGVQLLRKSVPVDSSVVSSATLETLVMASPLAAGFARDHMVFYAPPSTEGIVPIRISVTGSELVLGRDGTGR